VHRSIRWEGSRLARLNERYLEHLRRNPKSCESTYYGLFTDGVKKKKLFRSNEVINYSSDNREEAVTLIREREESGPDSSEIESQFRNIVPLFLGVLDADQHYRSSEEARESFNDIVQNVVTRLDSSVGFGAAMIRRSYSKSELIFGSKQVAFFPEKANSAFYFGHELTHYSTSLPKELVSCLARPDALGIRSVGIADRQHLYSEMFFGAGTNAAKRINKLLELGEVERAESLFQSIQDELPDQSEEAIADYNGIRLATQYILKNYVTKEEKRNAALSVLFSWQPQLYEREQELMMDQVGSKKLNQTRVLKGFLAHKAFRDLIGCEFESVTPVDCSTAPIAPIPKMDTDKNSRAFSQPLPDTIR
jgi:hypothetical protein